VLEEVLRTHIGRTNINLTAFVRNHEGVSKALRKAVSVRTAFEQSYDGMLVCHRACRPARGRESRLVRTVGKEEKMPRKRSNAFVGRGKEPAAFIFQTKGALGEWEQLSEAEQRELIVWCSWFLEEHLLDRRDERLQAAS